MDGRKGELLNSDLQSFTDVFEKLSSFTSRLCNDQAFFVGRGAGNTEKEPN